MANVRQELVWDELDSLLDPMRFVGRSVDIVNQYVGLGGTVAIKLQPYDTYIAHAQTAQLAI
jgi:hypothetical protein